MSLKTVNYTVKCALPCGRCAPHDVIIVLNNAALVAQRLSPIQPPAVPQTTPNTDYPFVTVAGQLINVYPKTKSGCSKPYAFTYILRYDDTQLLNSYSLVTADIKGVFCVEPLSLWAKNEMGNPVKLQLKPGDPSKYQLVNQYGTVFEFDVPTGGGGGSQGPQGVAGAQGATGAQGPQGAAGGGGGGSPTLACGLEYVSGAGSDIRVKVSGTWPTGQLAFPGPESGGGEIFCDSSGKLRAQPAVFATSTQATFVGSGGLPPTMLNVYNNPSPNRTMTVMVNSTYTFGYSCYGGGGGGPILSIAVDGGALTPNVQFLGNFGGGVNIAGHQSVHDTNIYTIAPSASLNVTRTAQCVKNNVADTVNNYAVSLRGIGVSL